MPRSLALSLCAAGQDGVGSRVLRCDLLDKPNNRATQFRVFDEHEGLHQRQAIRRGEKIGHVGGGDSRLASRVPKARRGRPTLEEERNRHLKDLGDMLQAAGADAVGALLVFLNLLERKTEEQYRSDSYRA
jgi:hypothetical protein